MPVLLVTRFKNSAVKVRSAALLDFGSKYLLIGDSVEEFIRPCQIACLSKRNDASFEK